MKLTVHTFLTQDGVMQGPGGAEEDTSGGFSRGGWLIPYADEDMGTIVDSWFARAEAILFGRTTFELMRGFWPQVTDPDDAAATALNGLPKYVVSSSLQDPGWDRTTVLSGDPVAAVRALKEQPGGELQVHGSARLAASLHAAGVVDEYRLLVFPVTVGAGKRLFTEDAPPSGFTLVESRVTSTGAVYTAFAPAPFSSGEVTVEDGREVTTTS